MARPCTCCTSPDALAIDTALMSCETLRNVAKRYGVSEDALRRHRKNGHCVEAAKRDLNADVSLPGGDDLLSRVRLLEQRATSILNQAERNGSLGVALNAIREARSTIELLAKLVGDLDTGGVQVVVQSAGWVEIRAVVVAALDRHPDAKADVSAALATLDTRQGSL